MRWWKKMKGFGLDSTGWLWIPPAPFKYKSRGGRGGRGGGNHCVLLHQTNVSNLHTTVTRHNSSQEGELASTATSLSVYTVALAAEQRDSKPQQLTQTC